MPVQTANWNGQFFFGGGGKCGGNKCQPVVKYIGLGTVQKWVTSNDAVFCQITSYTFC